ncbi:hypothetical protein HDV00_004401 [Rhizophlyctis rosea]|nr:hypothetical protein HDV00_004401 [Rhizophlyctis rosea]
MPINLKPKRRFSEIRQAQFTLTQCVPSSHPNSTLQSRVCTPLTSRTPRAACKQTRAVITQDDLTWAEAGWRHSTRGLEDCWLWAVRNWHTKILHHFLPDVPHESRRTVTHHAAWRGDEQMLQKILDEVKFDQGTKGIILREALILAAGVDQVGTVKLLLGVGATDGALPPGSDFLLQRWQRQQLDAGRFQELGAGLCIPR